MSIAPFVLDAIRRAQIVQDPFPHIFIERIFPDDVYAKVVHALPPASAFTRADYAGTARWKSVRRSNARNEYGLIYPDADRVPAFAEVTAFVRSDVFARALLEKFSAAGSRGPGSAIPADKHEYFTDGATRYELLVDLYRDLPGYEIPPHPDAHPKIVTFLFYLSPDASLAPYGTLLCRRRDGVRQEDLQSSDATAEYQNWYKWELFEVARTAPALPNSFLCFAPNEISYHAVRLDIPPEHPIQDRPVLRGFIVKKEHADDQQRVTKHGGM